MDIKLQTYYNKSNNFKKRLIDWCCIDNIECTKETFNDILNNRILPSDKKAFEKNFFNNSCLDEEKVKNIKESLKPITDEDIINLDTKMNELDGTLLVDVVWEFMRNHKIFI